MSESEAGSPSAAPVAEPAANRGEPAPEQLHRSLAEEIDRLILEREKLEHLAAISTVKNHMPSDFTFRNAVIGTSVAVAVWFIIMGISFLATRSFLVPLAVILEFVIIPIFITSGYTSRT
jgi:hypothetical protein